MKLALIGHGAMGQLVEACARRPHGIECSLGEPTHAVHVEPVGHHGEFVPAEARNHVLGPGRQAEGGRDLAQHPVAAGVSPQSVRLLEVVEVTSMRPVTSFARSPPMWLSMRSVKARRLGRPVRGSTRESSWAA